MQYKKEVEKLLESVDKTLEETDETIRFFKQLAPKGLILGELYRYGKIPTDDAWKLADKIIKALLTRYGIVDL